MLSQLHKNRCKIELCDFLAWNYKTNYVWYLFLNLFIPIPSFWLNFIPISALLIVPSLVKGVIIQWPQPNLLLHRPTSSHQVLTRHLPKSFWNASLLHQNSLLQVHFFINLTWKILIVLLQFALLYWVVTAKKKMTKYFKIFKTRLI